MSTKAIRKYQPKKISTPTGNPPAWYVWLYPKTDDQLYIKDEGWVERALANALPNVTSETSSATPTIDTDVSDIHRITALAVNITDMSTNLTGTPSHWQSLIVEITGTAARDIIRGADFEASTVALPTTTVWTDMLMVGFKWNSDTSKWRCVAVA
jgi:hypothetical protein